MWPDAMFANTCTPNTALTSGDVEHPFADHQVGARRQFTRGRAFFGRLKDELHRSAELRPQVGEDSRRGEEHRHVRVVTARVHDGHGAVFELARGGAGKRQPGVLLDGQAVHVRAQRDDRTRLRAAQRGDDAVTSHAGPRLEAEAAQPLGDVLGRLDLAVRELRVLMQMAAPREHLLLDGGGALIDVVMDGRLRADVRAQDDGRQQEREHVYVGAHPRICFAIV